MKRKLDKRKIKRLLGQAVIYTTANLMFIGIGIVGFMSMTVYR